MKNANKFILYFFIFCLSLIIASPLSAQKAQIPKVVLCPQCNNWSIKAAKFCAKCGNKLPKQNLKSKKQNLLKKLPSKESHQKKKLSIAPNSIEILAIEKLKAKVLYDKGMKLFEKKIYQEAKFEFGKIITHYPSSKYTEDAIKMMRICDRMNNLAWEMSLRQRQSERKGNTSSFLLGFLSSCGVMFLLVAAASGG